MTPEKGECLTLIFILNESQLEKSTLEGCKIKIKVQLFNRDAQEKKTTCKNYWKFVLNVNDFVAILYDNSKLFNFFLNF